MKALLLGVVAVALAACDADPCRNYVFKVSSASDQFVCNHDNHAPPAIETVNGMTFVRCTCGVPRVAAPPTRAAAPTSIFAVPNASVDAEQRNGGAP